ncbi:MAG: type I polyketide synthase, partial [Planctomycetota bacterium]|nr:type I polyketide synthase [Planctomycetota bacterium]
MTKSSSDLSPNKQALLRIRELKQQLADAQSRTSEPIAIVSMACRFPRTASTPERFWESLINQTDEVSEIPDSRWDLEAFHDEDPEVPGKMYARHGVFLENIDLMDPEFFGISPREATWVDPQQRLLMEVGWEALERAGWTPAEIGDQTGVFVGWMHNDYQNEASDSFLNLNPYIATGAAGSFLCGRLAYYLGLQGPSVAVDTACSSSLVALHLAIQSLQRHDCDRALVGGVNAICSPTTNILTCKLKALSPKGHSRAFDASADGYLRGEGCGVVTLRRLADAKQANDPILGIIRGSAVGHNGFSSGLTAPNPKAQEKVIRQALRQARIEPDQVAYLEAHGTGTDLGDPIELRAAAAALSGQRDAQHPLLVGSVKTNIGHLEAAAGMAGLIKVLLSMQNDKIPGQMNFTEPNPHIPWSELPVRVLTDLTAWPDTERKIAGVSAFGMSGTNAHVLIEAPQDSSIQPELKQSDFRPHIITLSAKSEDAIYDLAEAYASWLPECNSFDLAEISQTSTLGRSHFEHRAAVIAESSDELGLLLKRLARGSTDENAIYQHHRRVPRVAWQFTGQGSQYIGMGRELYETFPVFKESIDECEAELQRLRQQSLLDVMWEDADKLLDTSWAQPAIFAIQMGLANVMDWLGMRPAAVLGHSVGQYAAACVAGVMTWQDGIRLIAERGRLIGSLPTGGVMLAVFAPLSDVENELRSHDALSLAASNGTHNVISGPSDKIDVIAEQLSQRGIRSTKLETSHAFHSALMDPILEPFSEVANRVAFQSPKIPMFCNSDGGLLPSDSRLDGRYWADHIRQPVRFHESIEAVQEFGCDAILELGPQPILTRMATAGWIGSSDALINSLQRDKSDTRSLLQMVGRLYVEGVSPDFARLFGKTPNNAAPLPTYPFQRRRFWGPDKPSAFHAEYHTSHPLLGGDVALAGVENERRFEG